MPDTRIQAGPSALVSSRSRLLYRSMGGIILHQFRHDSHIGERCDCGKLRCTGNLFFGIGLPESPAGHLRHLNVVGHQAFVHMTDQMRRTSSQRDACSWTLMFIFHTLIHSPVCGQLTASLTCRYKAAASGTHNSVPGIPPSMTAASTQIAGSPKEKPT